MATSSLQDVVGTSGMTRGGRDRGPAIRRADGAQFELAAARERAEQNLKENMEKPILDKDGAVNVDEEELHLESGYGHGKKHKVPTRSTTAGRPSAASSSSAGATPKVKQRVLKRHNTAGSDCKKCLDADFVEADDDDRTRTGQDKELVTDAEILAEATSPWMRVLQSMMDAQADKMMKAVGVDTKRLDEVEVKSNKNYKETSGKFDRIEKRIVIADSTSKAQIASIEDRLEKLEICGGAQNWGTAQATLTPTWVLRHVILGGWADCTSREEIARQTQDVINKLPEDTRKMCLDPYTPKKYGENCQIRVRPGEVEAVTFTI